MCVSPPEQTSSELIVIGHIKNSQTRALLSILDAANIPFIFQKADMPKLENKNTQGNQGQDKKNDSLILRQKLMPMMVHNGFKILADMTKFTYYIHENFKDKLFSSGMWPKNKIEEVISLLDWYNTKFRPFMWEFFGIMMAASKMVISKLDEDDSRYGAEDQEIQNQNIKKL